MTTHQSFTSDALADQPGRTTPLGVRPGATLTKHQLRALSELETFDLTPVADFLVKRGVMPTAWAPEAILEFKRYLGLHLFLTGPVPMFSKPVDEVWHACLLHSRLYADLCLRTFGYFVHHEPVLEEEADTDSLGWYQFVEGYQNLFGELNRLWLLSRSID
jgi:hypothetical protein